MADKKTVLVVGGGYGGITVAQLLDNDFNVFVIDRKDYFLHTVGALRAAVMPNFAHNVILPYAKALKNGTVVSGEVARVDGPSIQLKGNDTAITADFVVIATGSSYAFPEDSTPTAYQDARIMYSKAVQALAPDERVLVVGGGPAGCELAGEIKAHYPQKSVTLVSRGVKLIGADYPDKLSSKIKATMESMGIVVKTGVAAECAPRPGPDVEADAKPVKVPLSNGEIVEVDRIFFCIGYARANKSCFEHTMPVSETGHIKVNEYLQVEGQTHVFAIGDCCNADKYEFTFLATKMAHIAAQNIKALAREKPMSTKYSRFKPSSLIFVSLGSSLGASVIGGCTWGNFVTRTIKSKQLLCPVYASALNVEYPDSKEVDIPKPDAFLPEKRNLPQSVLKALRPGPST